MRARTSLIAFGFAVAACGPATFEATGTEKAAGADATIEVDEIEGGNVMVEIEARFLTPPDRLGGKCYVVWFQKKNARPHKAGCLEYDADDREGHMRATFTERSFEVRITAEQSPGVTAPSGPAVIEQKVSVD